MLSKDINENLNCHCNFPSLYILISKEFLSLDICIKNLERLGLQVEEDIEIKY